VEEIRTVVHIKLENAFVVDAGIEDVWRTLQDVPRIAPCMPGAELDESGGEGVYRGFVKIKIGPAQLQFKGDATFYDFDPAAHSMKMRSRASDTKGRGGVATEMKFDLRPQGKATHVDVMTDLTVTGSLAQYGRGVGLVKDIANEITRQFSQNLKKVLAHSSHAATGGAAASAAPQSAAKPISGLSLILAALRASIRRWWNSTAGEEKT
jgi:carbon monoxide dehydrogenase subunit G